MLRIEKVYGNKEPDKIFVDKESVWINLHIRKNNTADGAYVWESKRYDKDEYIREMILQLSALQLAVAEMYEKMGGD